MIRTLAVDDNNDPLIDAGGNLRLVAGEAAVDLVAKHFIKALLGEMIFKADRGMPHFSTALGVNANLAQFEAAFRARMREIPDIVSVRSFEASIGGDVLRYSATLETIYGVSQLAGDSLGVG